jgi:hypothetical protein
MSDTFEFGSTQGWGPGRTRIDPRIERTITNDMKGDGRSAGSTEGFSDAHRVTIFMKGLMVGHASIFEAYAWCLSCICVQL